MSSSKRASESLTSTSKTKRKKTKLGLDELSQQLETLKSERSGYLSSRQKLSIVHLYLALKVEGEEERDAKKKTKKKQQGGQGGVEPYDKKVARLLGYSKSTINSVYKAWRESGLEGLKAKEEQNNSLSLSDDGPYPSSSSPVLSLSPSSSSHPSSSLLCSKCRVALTASSKPLSGLAPLSSSSSSLSPSSSHATSLLPSSPLSLAPPPLLSSSSSSLSIPNATSDVTKFTFEPLKMAAPGRPTRVAATDNILNSVRLHIMSYRAHRKSVTAKSVLEYMRGKGFISDDKDGEEERDEESEEESEEERVEERDGEIGRDYGIVDGKREVSDVEKEEKRERERERKKEKERERKKEREREKKEESDRRYVQKWLHQNGFSFARLTSSSSTTTYFEEIQREIERYAYLHATVSNRCLSIAQGKKREVYIGSCAFPLSLYQTRNTTTDSLSLSSSSSSSYSSSLSLLSPLDPSCTVGEEGTGVRVCVLAAVIGEYRQGITGKPNEEDGPHIISKTSNIFVAEDSAPSCNSFPSPPSPTSFPSSSLSSLPPSSSSSPPSLSPSSSSSSSLSPPYIRGLNASLFHEWFEHSLLPSLPSNTPCIISLETLPWHTIPSPSHINLQLLSKRELTSILEGAGESVGERELRFSLQCRVFRLIERRETYKIHEMAARRGHTVCFFPQHWTESQPLKETWAYIRTALSSPNSSSLSPSPTTTPSSLSNSLSSSSSLPSSLSPSTSSSFQQNRNSQGEEKEIERKSDKLVEKTVERVREAMRELEKDSSHVSKWMFRSHTKERVMYHVSQEAYRNEDNEAGNSYLFAPEEVREKEKDKGREKEKEKEKEKEPSGWQITFPY